MLCAAQADFGASLTTSLGPELQEVLESEHLETRLAKTLDLLKKEKELSSLQQEINRDVEQRISKTNRKYFLNEQLKSIKKELGMEKDDKDALIQKFKDRVRTCALSGAWVSQAQCGISCFLALLSRPC